MSYNSKYTGAEVATILDSVAGKQEAISDLDTIREGAYKGATALQSVPSEYVTDTELTNKGYATTSALNDKVDKVSGKQLSTEDFTSALKIKLEGLNNYDDTAINSAVSTLRSDFNKLVSGDSTTAIKTFNEIIAFLDGIADSESLDSIISSIEQQIAGKQATISDLTTIRSGAALGATAVQPSSLSQVATSGSYNDLSDKPTIPDVSNKVDKVNGKGLSTNDYTTTEKNKLAGIAAGAEVNVQSDWNVTDSSSDAYIKNKPTIPSTVTESTVSGWGFTKNTGTYSKPSGGIPKTDLASAVQTSLGKADSAIQSIKTINNQSLVGSGNVTIDTNPHYIVTSFTIDSLKTYIEQGVTEGIPFTDLQYVQWAFGSKKPVYVKLYDDESTSMYQMTGSYEDQWYFYILQSCSLYSLEVYDQQTIGFLSVTILPESFKTINGQPIIGTGNIEIEGSNNQSDIYVTRFTMEELWEGIIYAQENVESYFELGIDGQGLTEAIASHKSILIPRADYNGYAQVISVQYDQDDYTYLTIVDNTTTIYIGCSSNELAQGSTLTLTNNYITIESVDAEISPNTIVKRDADGSIGVSAIWDDAGVIWATESSSDEIKGNADYIIPYKRFPQVLLGEEVDVEDLLPFVYYHTGGVLTSLTIRSLHALDMIDEYTIHFFAGEAMELVLPVDVLWANGEIPTIEGNTEYELSLTRYDNGGQNVIKAILVKFS